MNDYRKIFWRALFGLLIAFGFAAYSHAAQVNLTHILTEKLVLMADLSAGESLEFLLPMDENLGEMRGVEISKNASSLARDYTLTLKFNQAPSGSHTLGDPLAGVAKNGRRFRLRKGTQVQYQLADTHNLIYEIRIPIDTLLEKVESTDPTEYALAANTKVIVTPPENGITTLTINALTKVEMIPGSASLGTTLQVEQRRAPGKWIHHADYCK